MRTFTFFPFLTALLLLFGTVLNAQTHTSVKSGNWSDATVWNVGTVPASTDDVVINTSHTITVDINTAQCANLQIAATGNLNIPTGDQLTMGAAGGSNKTLTNNGNLTIGGVLNLNGSFIIDNSNALLVMNTGSSFVIDGNDGTAAGSVPDGTSLFTLTANADRTNFNNGSTGGTITIVDPPQGNTSYAIKTATNFAVFNKNVTVALGNGTAGTGTTNTNGFGISGIISFGNLVVDNPSGANRLVTLNTYIGIMGDLTINSGELRSNNNQIYFNGNITNNGILTAFYLQTTSQTGTGVPANQSQIIGGSGIFRNMVTGADANMYGLIIDNSSTGGVTLQVDNFLVKSLQLTKGTLFIGNNTLVCTTAPNTNYSNSWVATNGTGSLKIKSVSSSAVLFPVGTATSYNPVTITNTGTVDDIGVRVAASVTAPNDANKIVNREWFLSEATAGGSNLSATFQWNANEEGSDFNRSFAYVGHFNGSTWDNITYGATGGSNPYTTTVSGITNLAAFAIGSGQGLSASVSDIVESVQSGNWNDPATWNVNRIPANTDNVSIKASHTVTLDANGSCAGLGIDGVFNAGSNTLNIGASSTHNNALIIYGTFTNSGATINLNGYMGVRPNCHFNMSAGGININGNDGNAATSVDAAHALLTFDQNANTSFTGGTVVIVNPHLQSTGYTIDGYLPVFGDSSYLQFGDGVSTQSSNNPNGFAIRNSTASGLTVGNLVVNSGNVSSRLVMNTTQDIIVGGNCNIISGELRSGNGLYVAGNLTNNGVLTIPGYLIFGKQSANSTVTQTVGGTGVFRSTTGSSANSAFGVQVHNISAGGVVLQVPLRVQYTYLFGGNVWLGNNDFYSTGYSGGSTTGMFVTNGTGKLWINYAGSSNNTLPVGDGTHYNPVTIANSGTADTIGVHFSNTVPNANNSAKIVNGFWSLAEKQAGGSNLSVTFQWNANQEASAFNRAVAYVGQYNGSSYTKLTTGSISGSNPYTITASGISTLQDYAIGSGSGLDASVSDAIVSIKTGNWNDARTWSTGTVPSANDAVNINSGHNVALDADGNCASLTINGTLTANAHMLTVGISSTNNNALVVYGTLSNGGAAINQNGYALFKTGSVFTQSAGSLVINGNNGNAATSVDATHSLLSFENSVTGNVTGGSIIITNPHLQPSGLAIDGYVPVLGTGSTLQFGDGISTQISGNAKGFEINNSSIFQAGNVLINTGSNATRIVTVDNNTPYINGSLTITSGELRLASSVSVGGDLLNNGTLTIPQQLALQMYSAAGTVPQSIGGSGVFRNSVTSPDYNVGSLFVNNTSSAGVSLNTSLTVAGYLSLVKGKVFLGNNALSVSNTSNASVNSYVVTNGSGALTIRNVGSAPVLFPVGTGNYYNPASITNAGVADDFTMSVSNTVTNAASITPYINAQWNISEAVPGGSNVTLILQWTGAQENAGFNRGQSGIVHFNGSIWNGKPGTLSGSDPYTLTASGFTSFSPFAISSSAAALPVTLTQFTASAVQDGILLKWQTATEENNSKFEIERSRNGSSYTSIGVVNGKGTTTGMNNYSFMDVSPFDGLNFYRLKQVDQDGKFTLSQVVTINYHTENSAVQVYPNPVHEKLYIKLPANLGNSHQVRVSIYNSNGQIMETRTINNPGSTIQLTATDLPKGIFTAQIVSDGGLKAEFLLLKQ